MMIALLVLLFPRLQTLLLCGLLRFWKNVALVLMFRKIGIPARTSLWRNELAAHLPLYTSGSVILPAYPLASRRIVTCILLPGLTTVSGVPRPLWENDCHILLLSTSERHTLARHLLTIAWLDSCILLPLPLSLIVLLALRLDPDPLTTVASSLLNLFVRPLRLNVPTVQMTAGALLSRIASRARLRRRAASVDTVLHSLYLPARPL